MEMGLAGNGEWRLEIGEWEDLPLAVGLYS